MEKRISKAIERYFELVSERPSLFVQSDELEIVLDADTMREYATENERLVGVAYESPWHYMLVDLVKSRNGSMFAYERVVQKAIGEAVVAVAMLDGKIALTRQYRHAPRCYQYSLVRGFAEDGLDAVENAVKELGEEIGSHVSESRIIGSCFPDSGLTSTEVKFVYCKIDNYSYTAVENITGVILVTPTELEQMIRDGEVNDGFTLTAFALCKAKGIL